MTAENASRPSVPGPVSSPGDEKPRTPICATCGGEIRWMSRSGFGQEGYWRHRDGDSPHQATPKVFIT